MMYILQIEFGTPEYDEAVRLRHEILRKPLGLEFTAEQLAEEWDNFHLGAYNEQMILLAYINLTPDKNRVIKMRQVAVASAAQRKGIGAALVRFSEQFAHTKGFDKMVLHARMTAVPFYENLEYGIVGEPFEEVTIPHVKMEKAI